MENEIKDFFRQTAPQPSDPTAFRLELNARMAAVEQIKAYRDREIRRSRKIALAIFVAGLLVGGAAALFFILHPVQMPDFMDLLLSFARWVGENHWFWIIAAPLTLLPLLLSRRKRTILY